jgi:hypothetical protein
MDGVTGFALAVLERAGLRPAVPVAADPGTPLGAGSLPLQAASAASDPAIRIARAASSIFMS